MSASKALELFVSDGRVPCPVRGDADVECCCGCQWLKATKIEAGQMSVRCTPPRFNSGLGLLGFAAFAPARIFRL
ncbi:MAG: hypothetical protein HY329_13330 [Chloroflexi bacterium]|nr:hypothetical protein [Chloroflexota bacterium]